MANDRELHVVWIIEGEEGVRSYHNTLPLIQQVIGWTNYFAGVCRMPFIESYSTTMTAYQILKIAQGYFEQELPNIVEIGNTRIDKSGIERNAMTRRMKPSKVSTHGVRNSHNSLADLLANLPNFNTTIGRSLAATGKSFTEITQMTKEELLELNGIGKVKVEQILAVFNRSDM